jgi:hypothetical protein
MNVNGALNLAAQIKDLKRGFLKLPESEFQGPLRCLLPRECVSGGGVCARAGEGRQRRVATDLRNKQQGKLGQRWGRKGVGCRADRRRDEEAGQVGPGARRGAAARKPECL